MRLGVTTSTGHKIVIYIGFEPASFLAGQVLNPSDCRRSVDKICWTLQSRLNCLDSTSVYEPKRLAVNSPSSDTQGKPKEGRRTLLPTDSRCEMHAPPPEIQTRFRYQNSFMSMHI